MPSFLKRLASISGLSSESRLLGIKSKSKSKKRASTTSTTTKSAAIAPDQVSKTVVPAAAEKAHGSVQTIPTPIVTIIEVDNEDRINTILSSSTPSSALSRSSSISGSTTSSKSQSRESSQTLPTLPETSQVQVQDDDQSQGLGQGQGQGLEESQPLPAAHGQRPPTLTELRSDRLLVPLPSLPHQHPSQSRQLLGPQQYLQTPQQYHTRSFSSNPFSYTPTSSLSPRTSAIDMLASSLSPTSSSVDVIAFSPQDRPSPPKTRRPFSALFTSRSRTSLNLGGFLRRKSTTSVSDSGLAARTKEIVNEQHPNSAPLSRAASTSASSVLSSVTTSTIRLSVSKGADMMGRDRGKIRSMSSISQSMELGTPSISVLLLQHEEQLDVRDAMTRAQQLQQLRPPPVPRRRRSSLLPLPSSMGSTIATGSSLGGSGGQGSSNPLSGRWANKGSIGSKGEMMLELETTGVFLPVAGKRLRPEFVYRSVIQCADEIRSRGLDHPNLFFNPSPKKVISSMVSLLLDQDRCTLYPIQCLRIDTVVNLMLNIVSQMSNPVIPYAIMEYYFKYGHSMPEPQPASRHPRTGSHNSSNSSMWGTSPDGGASPTSSSSSSASSLGGGHESAEAHSNPLPHSQPRTSHSGSDQSGNHRRSNTDSSNSMALPFIPGFPSSTTAGTIQWARDSFDLTAFLDALPPMNRVILLEILHLCEEALDHQVYNFLTLPRLVQQVAPALFSTVFDQKILEQVAGEAPSEEEEDDETEMEAVDSDTDSTSEFEMELSFRDHQERVQHEQHVYYARLERAFHEMEILHQKHGVAPRPHFGVYGPATAAAAPDPSPPPSLPTTTATVKQLFPSTDLLLPLPHFPRGRQTSQVSSSGGSELSMEELSVAAEPIDWWQQYPGSSHSSSLGSRSRLGSLGSNHSSSGSGPPVGDPSGPARAQSVVA
ncbi:hypothetical protein BGW38_001678 [Lunasporangiospora selenospora]|uniref:Uncharacterized protein n=1 Tax=Lunasporangiospora selenospora TaxID=979761 RepID=A0A9P6KDZ5_9FUNG|nr:hypothetical protein BGW38_001678 [Lunasporangiospora selenospora]